MRNLLSIIILLSITLLACADTGYLVGRLEVAKLMDTTPKARLTIKLDTGAKTSSLTATDIHNFKKDGKDWVRFNVPLKKRTLELERPVVRYVKIKNRQHTADERPVINIELCIGKQQQQIEVNLSDRTDFIYPLLLGRTAMSQFDILIDPQQTYTHDPSCETKNNDSL